MPLPVAISKIVDGIDAQSDELSSFLDRKTGEVIELPSEALSWDREGEAPKHLQDWQRELWEVARRLDETDDLLPLPSRFDVHEWQIMDNFALSLPSAPLRDKLRSAIRRSGAFRRFTDAVASSGLREAWFEFRDNALRDIAIEWCKDNDIAYTDDSSADSPQQRAGPRV